MSSNAAKIEKLAADWIARQLGDVWTEADQIQFDAWIAAHTAHRIAYVRLDAAWNRVGRLKALSAGFSPGSIPTSQGLSETRFPYGTAEKTYSPSGDVDPVANNATRDARSTENRRNVQILSVAASLALAIGVAVYLLTSGVLWEQRYATQVGAMNTVPLQDGSQITLNTDTRLRVALESHERRIELDRGEAFFDVAKDPARPFIVAAGDRRIVAVGTQFSVRLENDNVRVAVAEGKVRIEPAKPQPSSGRGTSANILVDTGGIAETHQMKVTVHASSSPEVDQLLRWRQGLIALHDTPLSQAAAEFNRYNNRKIVIRDAAIADIRVGGSFKSTNADAFLWMLQRGFGISVERTDDAVILDRL